jgi:hypothetical protein
MLKTIFAASAFARPRRACRQPREKPLRSLLCPLVLELPLRPRRQLQDLLGGELHSMRAQRVRLHTRDERLVVVGPDLETAVAAEYFLHDNHRQR